MNEETHIRAMQYALRLAARQLGRTAPNPAVGCVIVKDSAIIGIGATERGGRPHAETQAIEMAGTQAKGATMYVTLEPCSHHGQTPPCCEAIAKAGISDIYIACQDPNAEVNGKGIAYLKEQKINVHVGLCEAEALALNEGFFLTQTHNKPYVTAKIATSADQQMLTPQDEPPAITSGAAQHHGHLLRANHDAILTGIGTVLDDEPMLTCRIAGRESDSPIRIVLDRQLRIPPDSKLVTSAKQYPLWVFTQSKNLKNAAADELANAGVNVLEMPESLPTLLSELAKAGVTRLLLEAGPTLTNAFMQAGLVDALYWYQAPTPLGQDTHKSQNKPPLTLASIATQTPQNSIFIGDDRLRVYRIAPCLLAS
ncbi:MAG: bifunctional diaminohydroxyphosphoribosylaminopyrimidine deaminase/5-amino-6-(5-phosphoribosylamino)uracil reductase RibD [Rickettsiales bacterium]|nr:bifunctional diaminohydroxyphosphoribosylaminopyrimidine deaminase/5-amino-6-(5-phosphoribosylamino)uracil reductase RibD [Rickettsiales bacterium]